VCPPGILEPPELGLVVLLSSLLLSVFQRARRGCDDKVQKLNSICFGTSGEEDCRELERRDLIKVMGRLDFLIKKEGTAD
jgi:hypothetical protein